MPILLFIFGVAAGGRLIKAFVERGRPSEEVMHEFYDLQEWIMTRLDDPFMSDQKWKDLLPICRFADLRFHTLWRPLPFRQSCEALVLRILKEEDEAPV